MKFLYEKDNIVYAKCTNCDRLLKFKRFELGEIKTGVECFCGNVSNSIDEMPEREKISGKNTENRVNISKPISINPAVQTSVVSPKIGPVCPTCGSRNISKITLTSKAVGGFMFGVFSSNIRNTFKCNNCGYKW